MVIYNRYGTTDAAHLLEKIVKDNKKDSRNVTRLVTGVFTMLNELQLNTSLSTFVHISNLIVDDFITNIKNSSATYTNIIIPDVMINVVKTKRKQMISLKRQ